MNNCVAGKCQGTACGVAGEACCPVADGGFGDGCPGLTLACISAKCENCGGQGEPCCPGGGGNGGCGNNLTCSTGICVPN